MIISEIKQLKTGPRELRNFGLLVGGVASALGVFALTRGKPSSPFLLVPGLALMVLGALWPRALRYIYIGWMSLGLVLGIIVSNVLLTIFFFLVITPIGLVARLAGKDFLRLKFERSASTYWIPRPRQPQRSNAEYERQF